MRETNNDSDATRQAKLLIDEMKDNTVVEHSCSCIHGRKTMGVCFHVMSVIIWAVCATSPKKGKAGFLNQVLRDLENNK